MWLPYEEVQGILTLSRSCVLVEMKYVFLFFADSDHEIPNSSKARRVTALLGTHGAQERVDKNG